MKFLTLAVGSALVFAMAASGGDAKKAPDKLQGTWKSVSYEVGGVKIEGEALKSVMESITIKGDAYEWKQGDSSSKGTVKIDATKKHIDFVIEMEAGVKVTGWWGIYAVTGDTLKLCIGPPIGQRPTEFPNNNSTTYGVFTLKQAK